MVNLLIFLTPKSETLYLSHNSTVRQILENFDVHKFSVVPLIDDDGFFVSIFYVYLDPYQSLEEHQLFHP